MQATISAPAGDQIYDAALDDDAFAALPQAFATAFGARSAVMHWRVGETPAEIVHSGHFSPEHMTLLDEHFDGHDLWAAALNERTARNRAWCCHTLVPEQVYESGRLYNEWIRVIGDDSFHGLGAAFETGDALGEIGLHRGRGQGQFDEDARAALQAVLEPLRRMMALRARLAAARDAGAVAAAALDATAATVLVLRSDARLIYLNRAGEDLLVGGDALTLAQGRVRARSPREDIALLDAVADAGRRASGSTVAITGRSGRRYTLTLDPVPINGRRRIVVLVHAAAAVDAGRAARAAALYGLSATEAAVAAAIADGRSPQEIADERGTSVLTVRGQLKTVMGKMGVHRQSEVAAAVAVLAGSRTR